jgi:hypothetical protein
LQAKAHFINCHGASAHPTFHGEPGFPVAHDASWVSTRIANGTVAAVECCYGAELYDPSQAAGQMGIANAYLDCGAAAFFGSTTIAYGPAATNAYADVLCRMFLAEILGGRSVGGAALDARLDYVKASVPLDPIGLKTLAQFILLGDPSTQPVAERSAGAGALAHSMSLQARPSARQTRRAASRANARELHRSHPVARREVDSTPEMADLVRRHARPDSDGPVTIRSFGITRGAGPEALADSVRGLDAGSPRVHVALGRRKVDANDERLQYPVAVVAREDQGRIAEIQTVYGKSRGDGTARGRGRAAGGGGLQERSPGGRAAERLG